MNFAEDLLKLPRASKRMVVASVDGVVAICALYFALALRQGEWQPDIAGIWWVFLCAPALAVLALHAFDVYQAVIRFMGFDTAVGILKGVSVSSAALALIAVASFPQEMFPRSALLINWALSLLGITAPRVLAGILLRAENGPGSGQVRVAIFGAGEAGRQLSQALVNSYEFKPVVFLDDDSRLHGRKIHGLPVESPESFGKLQKRLHISRVLLAIPSVPYSRRREILLRLEEFPVQAMIMPGLNDLVLGDKRIDELSEVQIEDLLGREAVQPITGLIEACIRGKSVLVTGAGGSIGSELCRQIIGNCPRQLVLYEVTEFALYQIERELRAECARLIDPPQVVAILGTILDDFHIERIMRLHAIDTVYHAAAYKHVPLIEANPIAAALNNVLGTFACVQAAIKVGVSHFVLISTDKAVRPTNVMGASKRLAELVVQALAVKQVSTRLCMVRFGNVLGSSGSVVPLFEEQIRAGGPVTVTHPDITRYFMTIPEAASLVIQATSLAQGGDVFILDMGEPVKILDLARRMIHLSGLEVADEDHPRGSIEIRFTGLRPGEKLFEELLVDGHAEATTHPRIMREAACSLDWAELERILGDLRECCERFDEEGTRRLLVDAIKKVLDT